MASDYITLSVEDSFIEKCKTCGEYFTIKNGSYTNTKVFEKMVEEAEQSSELKTEGVTACPCCCGPLFIVTLTLKDDRDGFNLSTEEVKPLKDIRSIFRTPLDSTYYLLPTKVKPSISRPTSPKTPIKTLYIYYGRETKRIFVTLAFKDKIEWGIEEVVLLNFMSIINKPYLIKEEVNIVTWELPLSTAKWLENNFNEKRIKDYPIISFFNILTKEERSDLYNHILKDEE